MIERLVNMNIIIIIFSVVLGLCTGAQLPATFKTCKQSEANYSACLGAAIENAMRQLKAPHPELGLPSLDPLIITELPFSIRHKNINIDQKLHKLFIAGLSDITISHTAVDFKAKTIHFDVLAPKETSKIDFEWVGIIKEEATKIAATGIESAENGNFNTTATFDEYEQNGNKYIKIVDFYSHWLAEDIKFSVESADIVEAEHINKILLEDFVELMTKTSSEFDKLLGSIFLRLANELFSRVPVKFIFLD